MNFFKGLARAFTIPRATRNKIDNSALAKAVLPGILSASVQSISINVDKNVTDPSLNAAIKEAIVAALSHVTG